MAAPTSTGNAIAGAAPATATPPPRDRRDAEAIERSLANQDYVDLKRLMQERGLLDKQLGYYVLNTSIRLAMLAASVAFLLTVDNFWLQLVNAAFLAFAFTQIGYLGHDAGHRQIFNGAAKNDRYGLAINFLLGLSRGWWVETHNEHHVNPNDLERDPHTALPIFAFSEEQARDKRGPLRRVVGYQAFYFFPVLLLQGLGVRLASAQYLLRPDVRSRAVEAALIAAHFAVYFGLLFWVFTPWQALAFFVVHQATFGLYMGSVFAPNHKGMPIISANDPVDFLRRQVLTSRNVKAHPLTDFWYGGLNYQIEHHLFPSMPRNRLRDAQVIVRAFCAERGIPYKESGAVESHKEIIEYLHQVSAPLRNEARTSP